LKPDYVNAHWGVSYIFFRINRLAEAYDIIDKMKSKWPKHIFTKLILLLKYALEKNINKAKRILKPKFKDFAWNDFYLPLYMTECYALMDEKMEAVKWLERLIERGWINYPFLNYHDSFLENIRGEKRFKELMEKIKIEWENFEP
jgi:hypothetical protein